MAVQRTAMLGAVLVWAGMALPWAETAPAHETGVHQIGPCSPDQIKYLESGEPVFCLAQGGYRIFPNDLVRHATMVLSNTDGQGITYILQLESNCNLCATKSSDGGAPYWCWTLEIIVQPCGGLLFLTNGLLKVVYANGSDAWSTGIASPDSTTPWTLELRPNGDFGIYSLLDASVLWSTSYHGAVTKPPLSYKRQEPPGPGAPDGRQSPPGVNCNGWAIAKVLVLSALGYKNLNPCNGAQPIMVITPP